MTAGFYDKLASADDLLAVGLAEAERLAKLPRGAYVRTREIARGAALNFIEETMEDDIAAGFPT